MKPRLLILVSGVVLGISGLDVEGGIFPICTEVEDQVSPAISQDIVVWADYRNGNEDIYAYDFAAGNELPICTDSAQQAEPAIDGNTVVWRDRRSGHDEIYGYDLSDGNEFVISSINSNKSHIDIDGNIVVWEDKRNGNDDIYGYNLDTQTEFPICTEAGSIAGPAVSGNIVIWSDYRNDNWDIYGYDLSTAQEFPICTNDKSQIFANISGDIVVWQDSRDYGHGAIYGYDLATQTEFPICIDENGIQGHPDISGNIVVWPENMSGTRHSIYWHNLNTQEKTLVYSSSYYHDRPVTNGRTVVWFGTFGNASDKDIHGYDFACMLDTFEVSEGGTFQGTTANTTATADESGCGYNDTIDVWHSFVPQSSGKYTISLCGSDFDTTLAVFDDCEGTQIECNDDFCGPQSKLTVKAKAGRRYYIRVGGYDGDSGDYKLNVKKSNCPKQPRSDINGDCVVNRLDFSIMASEWLSSGYEQ